LKNKKVVLIIEDDIDDINLIIKSLEKEKKLNFLIVNFDGREALDNLGGYSGPGSSKINFIPDLILLDLKLPYLDGFDLLKVIRDNDLTKNIPVVVFTGSDRKEDIPKSYQYGANSFINKPVKLAEFRKILTKIFDYWLDLNINTKEY
jgi:CheY-like chemotaxis protein